MLGIGGHGTRQGRQDQRPPGGAVATRPREPNLPTPARACPPRPCGLGCWSVAECGDPPEPDRPSGLSLRILEVASRRCPLHSSPGHPLAPGLRVSTLGVTGAWNSVPNSVTSLQLAWPARDGRVSFLLLLLFSLALPPPPTLFSPSLPSLCIRMGLPTTTDASSLPRSAF